jgi:hypothetical protein
LSNYNLNEISELLHILINSDGGLLNPLNFEIVVVVHGEMARGDIEPLDMSKYPNILLQFVAPTSVSLGTNLDVEEEEYGRIFKRSINKAFDKTLFIWDEYGVRTAKTQCPEMSQGISRSDPQVIKEGMGFFIRLNDVERTIFKIADYNSTYSYSELVLGKIVRDMNLETSIMFISELCTLFTNILNKTRSRSVEPIIPYITITELSCRTYDTEAEVSDDIRAIWNGLLLIGDPGVNFIQKKGYITINTDNNSFFGDIDYVGIKEHSISDNVGNKQYEIPASIELIEDSAEQQRYLFDRIKQLAVQVNILTGYSLLPSELKSAQINIIHKIIEYYRAINFEFARNNFPVLPIESLLSSLHSLDSHLSACKWDDDSCQSQQSVRLLSEYGSSQSASLPNDFDKIVSEMQERDDAEEAARQEAAIQEEAMTKKQKEARKAEVIAKQAEDARIRELKEAIEKEQSARDERQGEKDARQEQLRNQKEAADRIKNKIVSPYDVYDKAIKPSITKTKKISGVRMPNSRSSQKKR